ncbi:MAG: alpha/beta hydrolase, partial [Hyphomicrobiaceae bacterium]
AMTSFILKTLAVGLICYGSIAFGAWALQRKLMYFPFGQRVAPASEALVGVEEVVLSTPDGERVIAWYGPAAPGQPTLLYFHGNAGNLAMRAEDIRRYMVRGRGMFMMSYRGYSGSTGSPTEAANIADARLAYDALLKKGVAPGDIVLYGQSLGSGIAAQLAAERTVGGVVLEAPFTSAVDVGRSAYPFLPVRWLMQDRYETMSFIGAIRAPLLVVHGERDTIIPVAMGRAVFAAANEPKEIVTFPAAGHNDLSRYGIYEAVQGWLDRLIAQRSLGR